MQTDYKTRLIGEKNELEENLRNEGFRDGVAYAKNAPYRELKLIDRMVEAFGNDCGRVEVTADLLACTACEVEGPDCDTRNWIENKLSKSWWDEEEYILGFIEGAQKVLTEINEIDPNGVASVDIV
jgi:hypothetical protein